MKNLAMILGLCAFIAAPAFAEDHGAAHDAAKTAAPAAEAPADEAAAHAKHGKAAKGHKGKRGAKKAKAKGAEAEHKSEGEAAPKAE